MVRPALLLILALTTPVLANNTGKTIRLHVALKDGRSKDVKVKFRKSKLEAQGLAKVPYADVLELSETLPHTEARAAELRAVFAARAEKLAAGDGRGWARLGKWARERSLDAESRRAFETAVSLVPENANVRSGLGQMKVDGEWIDARAEIGKRRAELEPDDLSAHMDLAKLARESGAEGAAFELLAAVLAQDSGSTRALKMIRPLTDRRQQQTRLRPPVAGRWKASADKTRHHQKNVSAIYALDLVRVDGAGSHVRGRGKQLTDHLAWGEPVYAAAAGKVAWVQTDFPDLPVGTLGAAKSNNGVGLDHGNGEVSWYLHFQRGSCTLKLGDAVTQGQVLGNVGNSGKANIPHLHFALAWRGYLGVPWTVDSMTLIAEDGTPVPARRIAPREGWTFEAETPKAPAHEEPVPERGD